MPFLSQRGKEEMTAEEIVRQCESPRQAILALARAVDSLDKQVGELRKAQTQDTWDSWDDHETHVEALKEWQPDPTILKHITATKEALKIATGDEERALQARLALLEDALTPPAEYADVKGKQTQQTTDLDGNVIVELPPASQERQDARREFAGMIGLDEAWVESFVKGGPLVIYYTDRDFVMGLPDDWRIAMVNDVEQDSPKEAHEMARDILKDLSPGDGAEVTMERVLGE